MYYTYRNSKCTTSSDIDKKKQFQNKFKLPFRKIINSKFFGDSLFLYDHLETSPIF